MNPQTPIKSVPKLTALLLALSLVPGSAPNPGIVFEVEIADHASSPPDVKTIEIKVEGANLLMPFEGGGKSSESGTLIFHGDRGENGELTIVFDENQSYMVIDDALIKQVGASVSEAEKMIEEQLKNLPPEQQEAIRKARESGTGGMGMPPASSKQPEIEIKETGEKATKAGYPSVKYEVFSDGIKTRDLWVTDWGNIDGAAEVEETFKRMIGFFENMMAAMPNTQGTNQFGLFGQAKFDEGFPVVTRGFDEEGNLTDESTLKSARRQTIEPAEFEPPLGYKRMGMGLE